MQDPLEVPNSLRRVLALDKIFYKREKETICNKQFTHSEADAGQHYANFFPHERGSAQECLNNWTRKIGT